MLPALILLGWGVILAVAYALCSAAARADRVLEEWDAERDRARAALDAMGAEAESVLIDFPGGWRN